MNQKKPNREKQIQELKDMINVIYILGLRKSICHEWIDRWISDADDKYNDQDWDKDEMSMIFSQSYEYWAKAFLDCETDKFYSNYPKSIERLKETHGYTIFFTGLSGAGKSTIANSLLTKLREITDQSVILLDGDDIRKHLSNDLGFSKEHRNLNIFRIGFIASEITRAGGIAIISAIAPYKDGREKVREMIEKYGKFIEIYVNTPISICETRDVKGLYEKARKGIIKNFTGIDDPYEEPIHPEITLDTIKYSAEDLVDQILFYLK